MRVYEPPTSSSLKAAVASCSSSIQRPRLRPWQLDNKPYSRHTLPQRNALLRYTETCGPESKNGIRNLGADICAFGLQAMVMRSRYPPGNQVLHAQGHVYHSVRASAGRASWHPIPARSLGAWYSISAILEAGLKSLS